MADYKKMYLNLTKEVTDTLEILQTSKRNILGAIYLLETAQQQGEETYIQTDVDDEEGKIQILPEQNKEDE